MYHSLRQSPFLLMLLLIPLLNFSCVKQKVAEEGAPLFRLLDSSRTGLDFTNTLVQTSEFNVFNYMYFYNGGGVAAGDFNRDGLADLFFTNNMGPNALFLNEGGLKFRDISDKAGIKGSCGWTSGVSVVDIDQDGWLDLYVSCIGDYQTIEGHHELYINQGIDSAGIPYFEERSSSYGLDLNTFGTQTLFFDYDLDGDLDLFILNHSLHANGTFGQRRAFTSSSDRVAGDRLYECRDGRYIEVTGTAGIQSTVIGYGLGVVAGDIDLNGYPDLYVCNDFHENDYLYLNTGAGTFREVMADQMEHTSRFSMGVDIADINNDAFAEVISLDMLPEDPVILKSSLTEDALNIFRFKLGYGYHYQYSRNALQLNNGNGTFSDIATMAGVHATDWSWAPLFFDFNEDGNKDLFISNGIMRRMNDIDYINYRANNEIRWKQQSNNLEDDDLVVVDKMPKQPVANKFYVNRGSGFFDDMTELVEDGMVSFSNGAVYVDLDNDGDLDIVTHNQECGPFVYQNLCRERDDVSGTFLLELEGPTGNRDGIGSRVVVYRGDQRIYFEHWPVRGYQSSAAGPFHVAAGPGPIDSAFLIWPDLTFCSLPSTWMDTLVRVCWEDTREKYPPDRISNKQYYQKIRAVSMPSGLDLDHEENDFIEFNRERLIPHVVSAEGPAIALGDVNSDGLDDIFIGGSKRRPSKLFIQHADGSFSAQASQLLRSDSLYEDVSAVMCDLDRDGDQDLIVASGGNEFWGAHATRLQRIYWNGGDGTWSVDKDAFGSTYITCSQVVAGDFNSDGWPDLFFAARSEPRNYGEVPRSYLFLNDGTGRFADRTEQWSPELAAAGMIKAAEVVDLNADGKDDLLIAVEWGKVMIFYQEDEGMSADFPGIEKGWWRSVKSLDVNGDGRLDIIAGNTGLNTKLSASLNAPLDMFISDFDKNGQADQLLAVRHGDQSYPFATYKDLTEQMPGLKRRFLMARDLAGKEMDEIFSSAALDSAKILSANTLASLVYLQQPDGTFHVRELPETLQFSTVEEVLPTADGGFLVGGNFFDSTIEIGRLDASSGYYMYWDTDAMLLRVRDLSEPFLKGQIRHLVRTEIGGQERILIVRNNGKASCLVEGI